MKANPNMIKMWSERTKCFMCKHKFDKPVILPVEKPERGKFQPNFNIEYIWHLSDTHGIPDDISRRWIIASIYGLERTLTGAKELGGVLNEN